MVDYDPSLPLFSLHLPKAGGNSFKYVLERWFNRYTLPNLDNHPRLYKFNYPINLDRFFQRLLKNGLWLHYKNHQFDQPPKRAILGNGYGSFLKDMIPECVHGHFYKPSDGVGLWDYYPTASQFVTILRNPLHMHISLYNYNLKQKNAYWNGEKNIDKVPFGVSLEEWVSKYRFYLFDFMPWELDSTNFKEVIGSNFVHVGIVENYQRSIDIIADKLGFKNVRIPKMNSNPTNSYISNNLVEQFEKNNPLAVEIYKYALKLNN